MPSLCLVPISFGGRRALLRRLASSLKQRFRMPVRIFPASFDPGLCHDEHRGQYNSTKLIQQMLEGQDVRAGSKVLGITGVDLFIPVLTYVFGEAQLDGAAAIVSTFRLQNEAYGLEPDEELLHARLEKESFHELGHTFGLIHCPDPSCVMRASTYVEHIDFKTRDFCSRCLLRLFAAP